MDMAYNTGVVRTLTTRWVFTVVVMVVLFAAGAMGAVSLRAWRDERAELRAELDRVCPRAEIPGRQR
jgi:hypothetical protein